LHNIALLRSIAILRHNACAITDGKLGCSSGGKSTSITLGYSVHCYAISLAGGQLQFRSSTPSVHQMVKTKKFLCAITDGKLGCSSGGKSTSITLDTSDAEDDEIVNWLPLILMYKIIQCNTWKEC
ncbi:hypothetical protein T12_1876, partial [Trichinella patagoniensis]